MSNAVAYVIERTLDTHEKAGTDLKSMLEAMSLNYFMHEEQALNVVRESNYDRDEDRYKRLYIEWLRLTLRVTGKDFPELDALQERRVKIWERIDPAKRPEIEAWIERVKRYVV